MQFVVEEVHTDMPAAENSGNSAISGIFSAFLQFENPTNSEIRRSMLACSFELKRRRLENIKEAE